jgi:glucose-6-phosphate isomerase
MSELTQLPAWQTLWDHFADAKQLHMRELFQSDPERAERYGLEVGGLFLDYSKNRITDETLKGLMQLAREAGLPERIKAMFKGKRSTARKTAPCCMWPCAIVPIRLFLLMAKT